MDFEVLTKDFLSIIAELRCEKNTKSGSQKALFMAKGGFRIGSKFHFYDALENALGKDWSQVLDEKLPFSVQTSKRVYSDKIVAYYAEGFRGNYLIIVPEHNIAAVRCAGPDDFNYETDFFAEFVSLVSILGKSR